MKAIKNIKNKKNPTEKFFGKTKLTPELQYILLHFHLIAYVKADDHRVHFYIIGRKRQTIEGRFADIVCLLARRKVFCKIHCSYMVNMDHVFVWCVQGDGLRLLLRTGQNCHDITEQIIIPPDDIAGSALTREGVNRAELAIRKKIGDILPVSEEHKKQFKRMEKQFPLINRIWECLPLKKESLGRVLLAD